MQTFEPPSINAAIKEAIENIEIIAPFDGFITAMPNIVGILHPNHKALMTAVKGSILCNAVELEYEMCAILSLDKSDGYNQEFNNEYIRLAKDTFGTKKKRDLKRHDKLTRLFQLHHFGLGSNAFFPSCFHDP